MTNILFYSHFCFTFQISASHYVMTRYALPNLDRFLTIPCNSPLDQNKIFCFYSKYLIPKYYRYARIIIDFEILTRVLCFSPIPWSFCDPMDRTHPRTSSRGPRTTPTGLAQSVLSQKFVFQNCCFAQIPLFIQISVSNVGHTHFCVFLWRSPYNASCAQPTLWELSMGEGSQCCLLSDQFPIIGNFQKSTQLHSCFLRGVRAAATWFWRFYFILFYLIFVEIF